MSADAWRECPNCKVLNDKKLDALYGTVSQSEYMAAVYELDDRVKETLREDYEISMNEDGVLEISYSCSCTVCKFNFKYKHSEVALKNARL
jgi:hypothetical protein